MIKRIISLLLIVGILVFLPGCWNNRDISELSILTAMGIDKAEDGQIELTAQIIKPADANISGSGVSGGGGAGKSFVTISRKDKTVFAAIRSMLSKVNRKVFYSSSQVIVIGNDLAESGIQDYIDYLLRDNETQYKAYVAVARDTTAKKVVEQDFELSKIPGRYLRDTIKNSDVRGFSKKVDLLGMARELATEGRELSLPTISLEEKTTSTEGMAVFKEDKMIGWLDKLNTRGYSYITNRVKSGILEIKNPENPEKIIGIENMKATSKIKVNKLKNDIFEFEIKIKVNANIGEVQITSGNDQTMKIAKALSDYIGNECAQSIYQCQNLKTDIFGFGMRVFDEYPKYWKKNSKDWNDKLFPKVKTKIIVETKIAKTGMLSKNIKIE